MMLRPLSSVVHICIIVALCAALCRSTTVAAMVNSTPPPTTTRRSFITRMPFVVIGAAASLSIASTPSTSGSNCEDINCQCSKCHNNRRNNKFSSVLSDNNFVVNAYERRDVGDETSSGETKAMNDQAYETNNRLERDGLVLEVCLKRGIFSANTFTSLYVVLTHILMFPFLA